MGGANATLAEHFSIGEDLIPREMITAYATLKKAAANANHAGGPLDDSAHRLIVQACDEILAGQHHDNDLTLKAAALKLGFVTEASSIRRRWSIPK